MKTTPTIDQHRTEAVAQIEARRAPSPPAYPGETVLQRLRADLNAVGAHVPANPREIIAQASSAMGFDRFGHLVESPIIQAFTRVADTTSGWCGRTSLADYKEHEVAMVDVPARLTRVGRGQTAARVQFGLSSPDGWRLAKFGASFEIDERDLIDGAELQPLQLALAEIGRAAARLIPDLVWSTILSNPTLADGVTLFHSSRNNLGSGGGSVLGATSLATALAAISGQMLNEVNSTPVYAGGEGRYLIVPPALVGTARTEARKMMLDDDSDLIVRSEPRISATGVFDPLNEDVIEGSSTNWLLAAPYDQCPGILIGTLDGMTRPQIRSGELSRGSWGRWFDISFSVGVVAVGGQGLYYSAGA